MFNNLSGYKCRAWYLSRRRLWRRPRAAAWEDQCLLQRGQRWQVRAQGRVGGPGAWHHGQCEVRTHGQDLQTRQLCVRPVWGRQQLGQGSLHRGGRVGGQRHWCCQKGEWSLWLSPGVPTSPLLGRWNWVWYGNTSHLQDQGGVSRQDHEHILRHPLPQGVGHRGGALQRHSLCPPTGGEYWRELLHWQWGSLRHLLQVKLRFFCENLNCKYHPGPLSWAPPPMATSTTLSPSPCPAWPHVSGSQVN